jgi:hypothetical protein
VLDAAALSLGPAAALRLKYVPLALVIPTVTAIVVWALRA